MSQTLMISVPDQLLARLNRLASAVDRPVEEIVVSTLNDSVPRPPTHLPAEIREELTGLEMLSDGELTRVAQSTMRPEDIPTSYRPGEVADRLALRKAYALVLLKWRGCPLHELDELVG